MSAERTDAAMPAGSPNQPASARRVSGPSEEPEPLRRPGGLGGPARSRQRPPLAALATGRQWPQWGSWMAGPVGPGALAPDGSPVPEPPARLVMRFGWLLLFAWDASAELAGERAGAGRVLGCVLAALACVTWAAWSFAPRRRLQRDRPLAVAGVLAVLCICSGVLCAKVPVAIGMLAVGGLAAGIELALPLAGAVLGSGLVALAVTHLVTPTKLGVFAGAIAGGCAGLIGGTARRQGVERDRQLVALALEHERLELEQGRAEVLAERNRVARDVHDVLAHTLGALAVQLEAADAVASGEQPVPLEQLATLLRQSRELVVTGLEEARRAVQALRDEPFELVERLQRLVEREPESADRVTFRVVGEPRALAPAAASALYRAAQEGLANARKHAAGAAAELTLAFDDNGASMIVANEAAPGGSLAASGGGVGLAAMRERVELAGGVLEAGASADGWRIAARVPG